MSAEANEIVTAATTPGDKRRRLPFLGACRSRRLFAGVPIALVSAIAMSLNLASPAHAAMILKKPLKSKSILPSSVPIPKDDAGPQPTLTAAAGEAPTLVAPTQYVVVEGDTVSGIGGRFGLSTASVLALNGLGWSSLIFPGQKLTLTSTAATLTVAPAPQPVATEITRYTIRSGDTISGIAAANGLPTAAVLSANGLHPSSIIFPGQAIVLPHAADATAASAPVVTPASAPAPAPKPASATYTIAGGDTISSVASVAGVSVQAILDANGLGWSSIIYPGQVLTIPTITPLTDDMRTNAATIVSVGRAAGVSANGLVVALAAAAQESGLRNVHHGDRDSLGLFQQRPSAGWGSAEQVMDPVRASLAFFGGAGNPNPGVTRGLLDVPGWESMTVTQAAQAVQISAYPNRYAKWEASARAWLSELG